MKMAISKPLKMNTLNPFLPVVFQELFLWLIIPVILDEVREALNGIPVLGFDTETKPSFKKGRFHQVALLQISTHDKAFLFRLNKIPLPEFVIDIMEDPSIVKVGVALKDDLNGTDETELPLNPRDLLIFSNL